jgi:hypothetical protein
MLSCRGGFVECDRGLLQHHSPFLKELMAAESCVCSKPIIIIPDISAETVCLALNLLVGSGKEVSLDYESLLPTAPVLSMFDITFTYGFSEIQVNLEYPPLFQLLDSSLSRHLWRRRSGLLRLTISGLFYSALRTMQ